MGGRAPWPAPAPACRGGSDRREGGFVSTELAVGIGLLVLPVACLVLTLPSWAERQATARAIAREVGRSTRSRAPATSTPPSAWRGRWPSTSDCEARDVAVALDCVPGAVLPRSGHLTARVTVQVPAVAIPGIGDAGAWHWTAGHTEALDPYRSLP